MSEISCRRRAISTNTLTVAFSASISSVSIRHCSSYQRAASRGRRDSARIAPAPAMVDTGRCVTPPAPAPARPATPPEIPGYNYYPAKVRDPTLLGDRRDVFEGGRVKWLGAAANLCGTVAALRSTTNPRIPSPGSRRRRLRSVTARISRSGPAAL